VTGPDTVASCRHTVPDVTDSGPDETPVIVRVHAASGLPSNSNSASCAGAPVLVAVTSSR